MRIFERWRSLDQKLIDRLDRLTGYAQKQWGWRLTRMVLGAYAATLALYGYYALTSNDYVALFFTAVWMIDVGVRFRWAKSNDDYPENWRKATRLNAQAYFYRQDAFAFGLRLTYLHFWPAICFGHALRYWLYGKGPMLLALDFMGVTLSVAFYLQCCTFLTFTPRQKQVWLGKVAPDAA